jgi:transposase-like protein
VPLVEVLVNVGHALHELVVEVGKQVLTAMLEQDREAMCGPRSQPQISRQAYRYGYDEGWAVLGGRKIVVEKPRVRAVAGGELPLPTWVELSRQDPLVARTVEQMVLGVSTRKYERSLEGLPAGMESVAAQKSSVSRRFIAATREQVGAFLACPLEALELPVIFLDATSLGDHVMLVALGVDLDGRKHVLGVWEGTTESFEVCRTLLRNLIERGLVVEKARLFVVDGGKGMLKAIRRTFGRWAMIQRCQIHKVRNVLEHLPEERRPWVRAQLRRAWTEKTAAKARVRLHHLADALEDSYPSAAASIREGLDETLTLLDLGVVDALHRSLRSTNPIENLQEAIQRTARRVKRWHGGAMALRWTVAALIEAEKHFRRVKGFRDLPKLVVSLARKVPEVVTLDIQQKAA